MNDADRIKFLEEKVDSLEKLVHHLLNQNTALKKESIALKKENASLKERLGLNSTNSSIPPSKDWKKSKKVEETKSKKPSGGKVGHEGHFRMLLDVSKVDQVESVPLPEKCPCGGALWVEEEYARHQVYELPEIRCHVTEYQLQKGCCASCGKKHIAKLPEQVSTGIMGVKLRALAYQMVSEYGLSRRELQRFLATHLGFSISSGLIYKNEAHFVEELQPVIDHFLKQLQEAEVKNLDETGHRHQCQNHYSWIIANDEVTVIRIEKSRGRKVMYVLLGGKKGVVVSDRYVAYEALDPGNRQVCWAHLSRDFNRFSMSTDPVISTIGKRLKEQQEALFSQRDAFKKKLITNSEWRESTEEISNKVEMLLVIGSLTDPSLRLSGFCKKLLKYFDALWTFTLREDVPPTNNLAERGLRRAVIWRKKYFSTRSESGKQFVAISLSILSTAKKRGLNFFEWLQELLREHGPPEPMEGVIA